MSINCRFPDCQWLGSEDEIFRHIELNHRKYLREPAGKTYYDFSLNDMQRTTFVLVSEGLYWFSQQHPKATSDGISFGIFHIGGSECREYSLKVGLRRDGYCEHWGPYKTQTDHSPQERQSDVYEIEFGYGLLELLNERIPSRKLRLYFGEYDDSDDVKLPLRQDLATLEKSLHFKSLCWDNLTCCVCLEFIRRDARFCENKHFVCLNCFDSMLECGKLKCPICRGLYLYDCSSEELEHWLRQVKWPDNIQNNQ